MSSLSLAMAVTEASPTSPAAGAVSTPPGPCPPTPAIRRRKLSASCLASCKSSRAAESSSRSCACARPPEGLTSADGDPGPPGVPAAG